MSSTEIVIEDRVARVRLKREEVRNAFNAETIAQLTKTFLALKKDPDVLVVILEGAGPVFCAGGDLEWMKASMHSSEKENLEDARRLHEMLEELYNLPKPTIARVQGAAFGGGLGLVAACDVAIASDDARFALSEVKLGLVPSVIGPFVLRKIGLGSFRALGVSGRPFDAEMAQRIGLIQEKAPEDHLDECLRSWIKQCLQNGPKAMEITKELSNSIAGITLRQAKEITTKTIAKTRIGAEAQEGMKAFLEKRKPLWVKDSD